MPTASVRLLATAADAVVLVVVVTAQLRTRAQASKLTSSPRSSTATNAPAAKQPPGTAPPSAGDPREVLRRFLEQVVAPDAARPTASWRQLAPAVLDGQPPPTVAPVRGFAGIEHASLAAYPHFDCADETCTVTTVVHTQLFDTDGQVLTDDGYQPWSFALTRRDHQLWRVATVAPTLP